MIELSQNEIWDLKESLLDENVSVKFTLSGTSMTPFLFQGDIAVIEKISIEKLKRGDIIAFKIHEQFIAHRLIKKIDKSNCTTLITKGDSCKEFDTPFNVSYLIGKVNLVKRKNTVIDMNNFSNRTIGKIYAAFPLLSFYRYIIYCYWKKAFSRT